MSGVRPRKRHREQQEARGRRRFRQRWGCDPWAWDFLTVDEVFHSWTVDEVFHSWAGDLAAGLLLLQNPKGSL